MTLFRIFLGLGFFVRWFVVYFVFLSSFENSVQIPGSLFNGSLLFVLIFLSSLYVLDINPCQMYSGNIFSTIYGLPLHQIDCPMCQLLALILGQMESYSERLFLHLHHVGYRLCFIPAVSVFWVSHLGI